MADRVKARCYLVYAVAPADVPAGDANARFNAYVSRRERGVAIFHDHFIGERGGVAVFHVTAPEHLRAITVADDLPGWTVAVHPLVYSEDAAGFFDQAAFTMRTYRGLDIAEIAGWSPAPVTGS